MSFDPTNPQDLLALANYQQNQKSLQLQQQIVELQKLQVINQGRIAAGLAPLAELPNKHFLDAQKLKAINQSRIAAGLSPLANLPKDGEEQDPNIAAIICYTIIGAVLIGMIILIASNW
jgi:hypothetical protein